MLLNKKIIKKFHQKNLKFLGMKEIIEKYYFNWFICIDLLKYHVFSTYSRNNLFVVVFIMIPYIIMENCLI